MKANRASDDILSKNISRIKHSSLVAMVFSGFILCLDFLQVDVWQGGDIIIYRILDGLLALVALVSFIYSGFLYKENSYFHKFLVFFFPFFVVIWSAIIAGIEITTIGFSTYVIVLLTCIYYFVFRPWVIFVFTLLSVVAFFITISTTRGFDPGLMFEVYMIISLAFISIYISWRRYTETLKRFEDQEQLRNLNIELNDAKKKLEEEYEKQAKEYKNVSEKYTQTEMRLENIFKMMPNGLGIILDNKLVEVNNRMCDITGYSRNELIGRKPEMLIDEDFKKYVGEIVRECLLKKVFTKEIRFRRKDNTFFDAIIVASLINEVDDSDGILITGVDITQKKNAEEKLRESEEKYKALYDNAPLSFQSLDANGYILDVNPTWLKTLVYNREEVVGKWFGDFLHDSSVPKFKQNFPRFIEAGTIHDVHFEMKRGDGAIIRTLFEGCIGYTPEGKFKQTYCTFKDITFEVEAKEALVRAKEQAEESNRLKTLFLNNMSHEIRTPMNGIVGFSDFLQREGISEEKRRYYAKIVNNSGKQLLRIIDDILEISTLETKQVKVKDGQVCLNDILMEQFSIFNLKSRDKDVPLYLSKSLSDEESTIVTDVVKLNKILSNLIENAIKFTNKGQIEIGYKVVGKKIELFVKDSGVGIAPEYHNQIFQRFTQEDKSYSREVGGLGIGLSIAKENAELLGGDISLVSDKGEGAVFTVTIPYQPVSCVLLKPGNSSSNGGHIKSVLVAEDEEVNYLYIEALLREEYNRDCQVFHAKNGQEAVQLCKNNDIGIVLMDIKMPVLNGLDATRVIKSFAPDLPIVIQTAYSKEEDKEKALNAGADDFITKPIDGEVLMELMSKYCGQFSD